MANNIVRKRRIIEILQQYGECSVGLLVKEFGVSDMTIRRDLQALSDEGKIIRTHGGAALAQRVTFEFQFMNRSQTQHEEKNLIAKKAAELIVPAMTVILGAGTTTLELAKLIKNIAGLTIITTSLPIASVLQFCEDIRILLLGGFLRQGSPDLTGALTEANLENFHADMAFLGADAIDSRGGVYDNEITVARMLDKMVAASEDIYAVADHTKIGRKALMRYSNLAQWNGLITDAGISDSQKNSLQDNGVNIIIAK